MPITHAIEIAPTAFRSLESTKEKKTRREVVRAVDGLACNPQAQGKPLVAPFEGCRSLRAVRSRYRIVYSIEGDRKIVRVLFVGRRKPGRQDDVYSLARKLLRNFLSKEKD